jgi:DNA-binding response OmpR family regulator
LRSSLNEIIIAFIGGKMHRSLIFIFGPKNSRFVSLASQFPPEQYRVNVIPSEIELMERLLTEPVKMLVLSIAANCETGADLLIKVRSAFSELPILVMAEKPCLETALVALRCRAQDYLAITTRFDDILQRVQDVLAENHKEAVRREILGQMQSLLDQYRAVSSEYPAPAGRLVAAQMYKERALVQCGPYVTNPVTHEVFARDRQAALSPSEFSYWMALVRHEPDPISHKTLVMEAQGYDCSSLEAMSLARWHIHGLRKTFTSSLGNDPIRTIRGIGYCVIY